ncbi:SRPBCC domain-containing protein [Streptomyces sp. RG80]|uniref:SRPBCC domain-containing protein n=1 Tax=Streptomyces sp. RG80 TaxID=3157340 RepID=UPI0033901F9A
MEHEVFVPVPAERLREALADPVRVARAVPGLQQDAGAEPVTGRLKVRVGGHTITYRGTARLSAHEDGSYAVEGDATEARGTGAVKLTLTLRVDEADGGATLTFDGTATADGRVTELPPDAVTSAATRLLNRFAENLAASGDPKRGAQPERAAATEGTGATGDTATTGDAGTGTGSGTDGSATAEDTEPPTAADAPEATAPTEPATPTEPAAPDTPLASEATEDFEPAATGDFEAGPDAEDAPVPAEQPADFTPTPDLPAEAAHARRTMIGRSAEEVDHAPPRGRYAPVPAPQTVASHSALRWAAPAAALVVASAIVAGRVLRRRR